MSERRRLTLAVKSAVLALFFSFFAQATIVRAADVSDYKSIFKPFYDHQGKLKIAIRQFELDSTPKYLVLDPASFKTDVLNTSGISSQGVSEKVFKKTLFFKVLQKYTSPADRIQNSGITEGIGKKGVFLTVDMCPSRSAFDKKMYEATESLPNKTEPVPVAIAISGRWIQEHWEEFDWILSRIRSGRLDVTWINHSYSHPYNKEESRLEENFLLTPGVDFEAEVLKNEALMLENGIVPSPFFRFPGLVSNGRLLLKLRALSLIPIGANAWLAKGEIPEAGSIILIHGNGNESTGIKKLLSFYDERYRDFKKGALTLLPIKDAFLGN